MHIDIFSYVIFNITVTALMTFSLFFVKRGYLGDLTELRWWTIASSLQFTGWLLAAFAKIFQLPELWFACFITIVAVSSLPFYFHALVEFKQSKISVKWAYQSIFVIFALVVYFSILKQSSTARIILIAIYCAFFATTISYFLLSKRCASNGEIPLSHKVTGYVFAWFAAVMSMRTFYYSFVPLANPKFFYNPSVMQDISFLTFSILSVGSSFGFLLMCIDKYVGKQKQVEHDLRIAAAAFQTQEGIMITDANSVILDVNSAFSAITGYSAGEIIGQKPRILQSGGHDKEFYTAMWNTLLHEGSWQGEVWNKRKNGEIYPQYLIITAVKHNDDLITNYVATITDITERKANEETIRNLSFYDSLTELPNRRLLEERLKHGLEINRLEGKKIAVFMMDLDKFKAVNDAFGHKAGDDLLKQVAVRIKACLPEKDMVARLGGDEFAVVLEEVNALDDIENIANAIIHALSQPFKLPKGEEVNISVSIGITLCVHPMYYGYDVEMLIDHADIALYHAKDNGKGRFTYFSETLLVSEEND
jgi:diguanylate cyclase (GGDEF)-like protein/PAS domain S-box-containing protein